MSVGRSQRDVEDDDGVHHDHHCHHHEEGQVPAKETRGLSCHATSYGSGNLGWKLGTWARGNPVSPCAWRVGTSCLGALAPSPLPAVAACPGYEQIGQISVPGSCPLAPGHPRWPSVTPSPRVTYFPMSGTAWEVSGTFWAMRKRKTVWARSTLMETVHFCPPAAEEGQRGGLAWGQQCGHSSALAKLPQQRTHQALRGSLTRGYPKNHPKPQISQKSPAGDEHPGAHHGHSTSVPLAGRK